MLKTFLATGLRVGRLVVQRLWIVYSRRDALFLQRGLNTHAIVDKDRVLRPYTIAIWPHGEQAHSFIRKQFAVARSDLTTPLTPRQQPNQPLVYPLRFALRFGEFDPFHKGTITFTAEALNPTGQKAISFDSTATLQPSETAMNVPDKAANEWAVRVYEFPKNFPQEKSPVEVLKAAEVPFPKGADASLKDGKLTVRNTKPNLELIDAWLDALIQAEEPKKHVHLTVKAVETKGDFSKMMTEWLEPSATKVEAAEPPVDASPPPPAMLRQFTLAGVLTAPQLEKIIKHLSRDAGAKLEVIKPKQNSQMYDLPAGWGGHEMKIESIVGPDGYTIEMLPHLKNPSGQTSTSVTIWDGQTVVLGTQPSAGVSRLLFITGAIVEEIKK